MLSMQGKREAKTRHPGVRARRVPCRRRGVRRHLRGVLRPRDSRRGVGVVRRRRGAACRRGKKKDDGGESGEVEEPDITGWLGIATGCMGMSRSDFCACTPAEFAAAVKSWREAEESRRRDAWERMRLLALMTVQPHVKQRLLPLEAHAAAVGRGSESRRAGEGRRSLHRRGEPPPPRRADGGTPPSIVGIAVLVSVLVSVIVKTVPPRVSGAGSRRRYHDVRKRDYEGNHAPGADCGTYLQDGMVGGKEEDRKGCCKKGRAYYGSQGYNIFKHAFSFINT